MKKAAATRERIIDAAVPIFNVRGYAGTSLSDVLDAARIQKGGFYRHFASKEELALAAFDRAVGALMQRYLPAMAASASPLDRLRASLDAAVASIESPAVPGGCPILNTAVEADGTNEALRKRAARAMTTWHRAIRSAVDDGIADRSVRRDADADAVASVITAAIEGAIMLTLLYRDRRHMQAVSAHLRSFIAGLAA